MDTLRFRPLEIKDRAQLKEAHYELFPIDYEDKFFSLACQGCQEIFSLAAFSGSSEELVGFAIGRTIAISKMETMERHRLGILDNMWDLMHASYVLTLGVVKKWQKQGIATRLLDLFEQEAKGRGAELMFLHVITYNESAIHLYEKCSYTCKTRMRNFYYIQSGRQPEPDRWKWDAFLFVKFFLSEEEAQQFCSDARQRQTCLGWNFCWSSSAKRFLIDWFAEIEASWQVSDSSRGMHISESASLFHRLFYRRK